MTKQLFVPKPIKVNRYTRAVRLGKVVECPECNHHQIIYHFSWSALGCLGCKQMIEKQDWNLPEGI